ncbi:Linoleoyl-CoA desaturase [Plesiocystis pacifica SIR-1]|uniref:Linoleoyl-CoA desaturase n=1 Tax=Plesiocystis pacifica SIR-1 TaxID=391625 RepID=A6FZC7_9BACT|nr:acyl-CoA desaturase [Plesiocystis pacifica]EDM81011.1 Linoleoyl-CoA desaturase [Plesiocystis pacifica SIR-1]
MRDQHVRFGRSDLQSELRRRVDDYFEQSGQTRDGGVRIIVKTALIFAWFFAGYITFLVLRPGALGTMALAISTGLACSGLGFAVQHDGGHRAYSRKPWLNRASAAVLDFLGGSSYVWRHKHGFVHHTYPNVTGVDEDIHTEPFARMHGNSPYRAAYRFQHIYIWALYALLPFVWVLYDDVRRLWTGKVGSTKLARPKGREVAIFLAGKVVYCSWAFLIPAMTVGWASTLLFYVTTQLCLGLTLAIVFQMAHCVEEAEFVHPAPGGPRLDHARLQLATTVDFAQHNRLLSWYVGGLNFQVVHHLFPAVSHIHYPALSKIVAETCAEFDVEYRVIPTLPQALRSHYRFLRRLGQPDATSYQSENAYCTNN